MLLRNMKILIKNLIPKNGQPLGVRELEKPLSVSVLGDLDCGWDCLKELYKLRKPEVRHPVAIGKNTEHFT